MTTHSSITTWKIPWTEEPGSPWGHKESDTTEYTHTHTHQYSCLKSPMDRGGEPQSKGETEHTGTHIPQAECEPSQKRPRAWGSPQKVRGALT